MFMNVKGDNITCEEADSCDDCISFAKFDCGWCTNKDKYEYVF